MVHEFEPRRQALCCRCRAHFGSPFLLSLPLPCSRSLSKIRGTRAGVHEDSPWNKTHASSVFITDLSTLISGPRGREAPGGSKGRQTVVSPAAHELSRQINDSTFELTLAAASFLSSKSPRESPVLWAIRIRNKQER